ncbi:hypothetical protein E4U09_000191 [Claviceps aff. purpurea]|uniref:DUF6570 domain-containing protein n=1 Tax=Claviceps aff. purpurea TaxID=1967640 RepID=A0A9P7Q9K4_9HYPO|nr:hypothetical protein E4U09_000191 [Claviceps aff. purpurea]
MIRQFMSAFRVRSEAIAQWLNWLARNYPLYCSVVIDPGRLQQLPVDGDVSDQLPTIEADAVQAEQEMRDAAATDNDSTEGDELWGGAGVSHLMAHQTDVGAFKEQILQGPDAPASQSITLRPASPNISLRRVGRVQSAATSQDSLRDAFNLQSTASPQSSPAVPSPTIKVFGQLTGLASGCLQSVTNCIPCRATSHAYPEHQADAD